MNSYRLKRFEAVSIVLTVLISTILLGLPNTLINTTGSATLLNIVFITILTLIIFLIINKIFIHFPGCNIIDICEFLGGKPLKFIYSVCFIGFIILLTAMRLSTFAKGLSLIYFSHLNIPLIILAIVCVIGTLNFLGFKSICRATFIWLPLMIFSICFLYFSSLTQYTFQRVFPILGFGVKETFLNGLVNFSEYGCIYILFFIFPMLVNVSDFKKVGVTSILFYAILMLFVISALLFSFPQISSSTTPLSLYLLARQISLGDYIQSIDALFLLIWIPFLLIYSAINLHLVLGSFKQLTKIKHSSGMIYGFCAIIFVIAIVLSNMSDLELVNKFLYRYITIGFFLIFSIAILIMAGIKKLFIKLFKKEISTNV